MGVAGVPLSLFDPIKLIFEGKDPETVVADRRIMAPVAGAILVLLAVLTMTGSFTLQLMPLQVKKNVALSKHFLSCLVEHKILSSANTLPFLVSLLLPLQQM